MEQIVKIDHTEYGLDASEAHQVQAAFEPMLAKMVELSDEFDRVTALPITEETCALAKELRLKYVKVRTGVEKIHKKVKAYYLAGGRFVDGWKNAQKFASEGKEEALREIEEHFEHLEQARIAELEEERATMLEPYGGPVPGLRLGELDAESWENFFTGAKARHEAKVKAEKEAEERRIAAEKAEQERIQKQAEENARLKAEAEKREKEIAAERARVEAERKKAEEAARKEREEAAAKAREEERQRMEAERVRREAEQEAEARRVAEQVEAAESQKTEREHFMDFLDAVLEVTGRFSFEDEQFAKAHSWFARNAESISAKIRPVTGGVAA